MKGTGQEIFPWADNGKLIREARKKLGLTLESASKEIGCSITTLSCLERGLQNPITMSPEKRTSICSFFNISERDLIGDAQKPLIPRPRANEDQTGKTYGMLKVMGFHHKDGKERYWVCQCDCGNQVILSTNLLWSGRCNSCGCLREKTARDNMQLLHEKQLFEGVNVGAWERTTANADNASTKIRGVSYLSTRHVYVAYIRFRGKYISKSFRNLEDAIQYRQWLVETYAQPVVERSKAQHFRNENLRTKQFKI